jgi:hypothetical protein
MEFLGKESSSRHIRKDSVVPMCAGRGSSHLVFVVVPGWPLSLLLTQPNLARPVIVALFQIACKIPDRVDL